MADGPSPLIAFSGTARLFPLPDLVLFPGIVQPLHIFEPRYRQMTADALADDRLLAMALLRPGWEPEYHHRPPIFPVVCLGRIAREEQLPDGRYNLLLHGLRRARVREEMGTDRPYRVARVELLDDEEVAPPEAARELRDELGRQLAAWLAARPPAREQMLRLLKSEMPLGPLCDLFSFALPLDVAVKQALLEEPDVGRRARTLVARLGAAAPPAPAAREFPPPFSTN
jgi:Lon protease-like protein